MGYAEQSKAAGRHIFPDLARAFALIGIAVVNVGLISYPMLFGFLDGGLQIQADKAAFWTINTFFLHKSYTLFSFMFGVGFAYQIISAQKYVVGFAAQYARRITGLLVLGLLHVALLFQGDILFIYGILGAILFLFRNAGPKTLVRTGIGIYAIHCVITGLVALGIWAVNVYAPDKMITEVEDMMVMVGESRAVFGEGTFAQSVVLRFKEWGEVISFGLVLQGFAIFAFFLFGLGAVKSGLITNPSAPIWSNFRRVFLPIGILGSAYAAWLLAGAGGILDPQMMSGMFLIAVFSPFSTAGYLGLIAKWAKAGTDGPFSGLKTFMARGGTATLTAYLMQGLLMSLIFNAYGLGLFRQYGAATCILIAFAVAVFTLVFASLWRTKFVRGPMEILFRRWTYLGAR